MPRSSSFWLTAAGVYNLVFGVVAVAAPIKLFEWIGAVPPRYPELWQCIGMIVGVYGVGYLIAARDPARHWPIVLVGLLGKVFGPIGFVWGVFQGNLPAELGWVILANDLIWWIPFGAILLHAFRANTTTASPGSILNDAGNPPSEYLLGAAGQTLAQESDDRPLLVVFLRHGGCIFCRETLSDLASKRAELREAGVRVAVVHMGTELRPSDKGIPDWPAEYLEFRDPQRLLYREFGLSHGQLRQLLGPAVWSRGYEAFRVGKHFVGKLEGDGFQMPGAFVIHRGRRLASYVHRYAGDRPDYVAFVREGLEKTSADSPGSPSAVS